MCWVSFVHLEPRLLATTSYTASESSNYPLKIPYLCPSIRQYQTATAMTMFVARSSIPRILQHIDQRNPGIQVVETYTTKIFHHEEKRSTRSWHFRVACSGMVLNGETGSEVMVVHASRSALDCFRLSKRKRSPNSLHSISAVQESVNMSNCGTSELCRRESSTHFSSQSVLVVNKSVDCEKGSEGLTYQTPLQLSLSNKEQPVPTPNV